MGALRRGGRIATVVATLAISGWAAGPAASADAPPPDRCYLAALHEIFLDRPASVYELEMWTDRVGDGDVRAVASALATSDAWLAAVVDGIYETALDRAPDPAGRAFWVERLRAGTRVVTLTASIYGSQEVWARAGGTREGFVEDVFPRIMGRQPSPDDVAYWAGELTHQGPGDVAKRLLGSIENRRARVTALYQEILGRAPDAGGLAYWAGRLATLDDVRLAIDLARSAEAHQQAQEGCEVPPVPVTTTLTTGATPSAGAEISGDGRWVAYLNDPDAAPGVATNGRELYLLDRTTGETVLAVAASAPIQTPVMSHDGRHIAFATTATELPPAVPLPVSRIFTWDRVTGTITRVSSGGRNASGPDISSDGGRIVYSTTTNLGDLPRHNQIVVWDRASGDRTAIVEDTDVGAVSTISPDGDLVAFNRGTSNADQRIEVWDASTGTTTTATTGRPEDIADDGDLVVQGGSPGVTLRLHDAQTATSVTLVTKPGIAGEAELALDGRTVTFTSRDDRLFPGDTPGTDDVFVWERATGAIAHISPPGHTAGYSATSSDGRFVVFQSAPRSPADQPTQITLWDRGS